MGTVHKPVFVADGKFVSVLCNETNGIAMGKMVAIDVSGTSTLTGKIGTAALKALGYGIAKSTRMTGAGVGNSSYNLAANGETFSVMTRGIAYAIANGTITVGDSLELANSGALANGSTNTMATALESATDGESVKVQLLGRTW